MRSTSPALHPRVLLLTGALLLSLSAAVPALEIEDTSVKVSGPELVVDVVIDSLFGDEVVERLHKGMPATLILTVDLWRDRSNWFDHLVATSTTTFRMRYDIWSGRYEIQRNEGDLRVIEGLDTLRLLLQRRLRVPVADVTRLHSEHRYYAAVSAYLRPLTLDDIEDVEQYLGRGARSGPSLGSVIRLPDALIGLLFAVSGFEDEVATDRTAVFRVPERLRQRAAEIENREK